MLTELHIEHLGVIERLELVLGPGLTVLSGETGAGKTMLVEAIELLVGGRADASMVRHGCDEARVDGRFVVDDGEREVVLTRVVPAVGRSRAYVDGRPSTVAALADVTSSLVDLHGQHAHQSLLSTATQRAALDRFGGVDLGPLRAARAEVTELDASLATLGGDAKARAREIDLLRYQVAELDAASIEGPDEEVRLTEREDALADAVSHREAGAAALDALTADGAGRDALATAAGAVSHRAPYREVAARLGALLAEVDDLVSELRAVIESVEEDPARLADLRARRQQLRDLCRKYGDDLAEVIGFHASATERLAELERYEQRAAELDADRRAAIAALERAALEVGHRRRAAAPALAAAVEEGLRTLAMPNASVVVDVGGATDDPSGDRVQFLLAANPGTVALPLTKVASGGELARAMLALRLALLGVAPSIRQGVAPAGEHGAGIGTLVFDEVDAGIGGAAAVSVARALADLAIHHQVLVVTHLPQVAAFADRQVLVSKTVTGAGNDAVTVAGARVLVDAERVDELARMLSGSVTETAREHARELIADRSR